MTLNQIAAALQVPLPLLTTGRLGRPTLKLVKTAPVDKPKKPE